MYNVQVLSDYTQWYRCVRYEDGIYARELHVTKLYFPDERLFGVCTEDMDYVVKSEVSHVDAMRKLFGEVNMKDDGSLIPCIPSQCIGGVDLFRVSLSQKSTVVENKRINGLRRFVSLPPIAVPDVVENVEPWYGYVNCFKDDLFDKRVLYKSGTHELIVNLSGRYKNADPWQHWFYEQHYTLESGYVYTEDDSVGKPYRYRAFNEVVMA